MPDRWSTNLLSSFVLALMFAVIGCGSEDTQPSESGGAAGSGTGGAGGTGATGGAPSGGSGGTGGVDGGTAGSDAGAGAEAGNAGTGGSVSDAGPADTNLQSTVTHDGVTIDLAAPALVGFFIDGYPFVVGPTVVTGYTPAPATLPSGRIINGCMKNPPMRKGEVGFDSAAGDHYDDGLNDANNLPLTLDPGDSLLVAVSDEEKSTLKSHLSRLTLLTVVDEVPVADAFRPAYAASSFKTMFTYSQVDTGKLKSLEVVGSPPGWDEMEERMRRITQDLAPNWNRDYLEASGHGPLYGRDLCKYEGRPYVMVNSDYPVDQKKQTLIGLIQRGIDRYGLFLSAKESGIGHPWTPDGGHNSGRKFSILFAGALLGDKDMTEVWKQTGRFTDPNTQGQFQEDAMIFYVEQVHVDATHSADWSPPYDDRPHQPYSESMIGMPDWRGRADDPYRTDASWVGHPYRISTNNGSQHGQALSLLVMGLESSWGNDAYLDYHTRFLEIMSMRPDPWGTERGAALSYDPVVGSQPEGGWDNWQKNWNDVWVWEMAQHHWEAFYAFPW